MANKKPDKKNFLTEAEIEKFLKAARKTRNGIRDYCMALMAYRHGFRVGELVDIRMDDIDLESARVYVRRSKGSFSTHQPIEGDELRALRAWMRERSVNGQSASPFLFFSERGPFTRQAMNYLFSKIGKTAELSFKVNPHMLRHSCGYALANQGKSTRDIQDWLGHTQIQHTVIYTKANSERFKGFWRK